MRSATDSRIDEGHTESTADESIAALTTGWHSRVVHRMRRAPIKFVGRVIGYADSGDTNWHGYRTHSYIWQKKSGSYVWETRLDNFDGSAPARYAVLCATKTELVERMRRPKTGQVPRMCIYALEDAADRDDTWGPMIDLAMSFNE